MIWVYAGLALLSGAALSVQVGLNNGLRERMGHPVHAALVSFGIGSLALMAYALALRPGLPRASELARGPWWIWLGGIVGACYVMAAVTFSNKLGAAGWLGVVVAGQILTSVLLDHFGLVGFTAHPASSWRIFGVALLLAGAAIVLRS
ncbi:DMT family transporter [Tundrisphaera lichenicola]|uniref:DMT family transporter n=1 Tax=Tundrisphaera lichenicola TaxID=2029860 RepID=UPI003EBAD5F7